MEMPESMVGWAPPTNGSSTVFRWAFSPYYSLRFGFAVEAILFELLVERVAVDAEAAGGLDLHAGAFLEDLVDDFAFDRIDDACVDVVGLGAGVGQPDADELLCQT